MKKTEVIGSLVGLLVLLILPQSIHSGEITNITIEDVAKEVREQNYLVLENATRVYQAKKSIQAARRSLLPKLNLWRIGRVFFDWSTPLNAILEVGQDIAPFLVPNNWFRVEQNKILYRAQKEAYRALWANEIMVAKSLFYKIALDQEIVRIVNIERKNIGLLYNIAKTKSDLGALPKKVVQELEIWKLDLEQDSRNLDLLLREEINQLSFALGKPLEETIAIIKPQFPDLEKVSKIDYEDFIFRALDTAAEIRQFEHYMNAIKWIKREIYFSFLGGSTISRGVGGGVFDHLPDSGGLGFETGPKVSIVKSEKKILGLQKKGIEETIKRQVNLVVEKFNLNLISNQDSKKRLEITSNQVEEMYERLNLGDDSIDLYDLAEAVRNETISRTLYYESAFSHMVTKDRLERLIYYGDYDKNPAGIEGLK